jgi:CelD/BcsL family acetyltransferase involved in cellulose biosynthesis
MDGSLPQTNYPSLSAAALRLAVHASAAPIEAEWRALESRAVASVYQCFDWIDCWVEHATEHQGIRPAIVTIRYPDGALAAILPLGVERVGPVRVGRFLGGEHANIRMGLLDPAFAHWLSENGCSALLDRVAKEIGGLDLIDLDALPARFEGARNPLAMHPGARPARCDVPTMRLASDFAAILRLHRGTKKSKKRRWQAKMLAPVGGARLVQASSEAEAMAMLDTYLAQKTEWFRDNGIPDSFAEPGITAFFRALAKRRSSSLTSVLDLRGVEIEGKLRALLGSGTHKGRMSGYFMSLANDEWRRVSPGELMLYEVISDSCARGLTALDLGRGDERYKASWLDELEPHVRVIVPFTVSGQIAAMLLRARDRLERSARNNPKIRRGLGTLRRWRRDGKARSPSEADAR